MLLISFFLFLFLLCPIYAYAWGPLTHIYLGNEILSLSALIPAGIIKVIRRHKKDFLYGTLMADLIVGKKYLPEHKNAHNWEFALELLKSAETQQQKAFAYGYLSHLAADTVAHDIYTADRKNIGHTLLEMKADSIIDKKYWQQAIEIDKTVQLRNDIFLEKLLERYIFSFKTNKKILKGMVYLSVLNTRKITDFIDNNIITSLPLREAIEKLHQESLERIIDLFRNWEKSEVIKINPSGRVHKKSVLSNEFKTFLFKPLKLSSKTYKKISSHFSRFK